MDKEKALEQLKALEAEMASLREIIEAPEAIGKPGFHSPVPGSRQDYWVLGGAKNDRGTLKVDGGEMEAVSDESEWYHGTAFAIREQAEDMAKAIQTMMDLRIQEGVVNSAAVGDARRPHYIIAPTRIEDGRYKDWSTTVVTFTGEVSAISPLYESTALARKAVNTVGKKRVIHMFNTLGLNNLY